MARGFNLLFMDWSDTYGIDLLTFYDKRDRGYSLLSLWISKSKVGALETIKPEVYFFEVLGKVIIGKKDDYNT